jgi:hypothetical protein
MMALGFAALGWFFWQRGNKLIAGVFGGLLLLSGPSLVFGLLMVLIGWGIFSLIGGYRLTLSIRREEAFPFAVGILSALVIFGTLFMLYPEGLSFMLQAFPDYTAGWFGEVSEAQIVPMVQVLLALPVYQPFALLFGLIIFIDKRNFHQPALVFLMCTFLAALLLVLIDPARQIWMLVWALIPLWILAGTIIGRFLHPPQESDRVMVWSETVFYLILLIYWWFNLSKMSSQYGFVLPPETTIMDFLY